MNKAISLCYHDIFDKDPNVSGIKGTGANIYKIQQEKFQRQIKLLNTFTDLDVVSILDLNFSVKCNNKVMLTFDDGGISAYTKIFPILENAGMIGHFFIIGDRIGKKGFVSESHLREMRSHGHIIGTHSFSHPSRISSLSSNKIKDEWENGIQVLEDILSEKILVASIPNGYNSKLVMECASNAGISHIFTSDPTIKIKKNKNCSIIGRYPIQKQHDEDYVTSIVNRKFPIIARHAVEWRIKSIIRSVGGDAYLKVRKKLLNMGFGSYKE
jgi:peptidoglycan/xylan/chitin deacetylase (PgdA/CDA1 family)